MLPTLLANLVSQSNEQMAIAKCVTWVLSFKGIVCKDKMRKGRPRIVPFQL